MNRGLNKYADLFGSIKKTIKKKKQTKPRSCINVCLWLPVRDGRPLRHETGASHRDAVRLRPRHQLQLLPAQVHLRTKAGRPAVSPPPPSLHPPLTCTAPLLPTPLPTPLPSPHLTETVRPSERQRGLLRCVNLWRRR